MTITWKEGRVTLHDPHLCRVLDEVVKGPPKGAATDYGPVEPQLRLAVAVSVAAYDDIERFERKHRNTEHHLRGPKLAVLEAQRRAEGGAE